MAKRTKKKPPTNAVTYRGRWRKPFLETLAKTGNVTVSAEAVNIDRLTAYNTRDKDKEFAKQWEEALKVAIERMEHEADRRAVEGLIRKKFTKDGEPIIDPATGEQYVEHVYSDTLLMFRLKALDPKYRDTQTHVHHDGDKLKPADGEAEADQLLAELRKALGGDSSKT